MDQEEFFRLIILDNFMEMLKRKNTQGYYESMVGSERVSKVLEMMCEKNKQ